MKKLIDLVTKKEGLKKSVSRAQISEVLGIVSEELAKECLRYSTTKYGQLVSNGLKRLKEKKKNEKK